MFYCFHSICCFISAFSPRIPAIWRCRAAKWPRIYARCVASLGGGGVVLRHGVEVLIVRRVGRTGDADGFDLLWYVHRCDIFIGLIFILDCLEFSRPAKAVFKTDWPFRTLSAEPTAYQRQAVSKAVGAAYFRFIVYVSTTVQSSRSYLFTNTSLSAVSSTIFHSMG